jgi:hypothetical protein
MSSARSGAAPGCRRRGKAGACSPRRGRSGACQPCCSPRSRWRAAGYALPRAVLFKESGDVVHRVYGGWALPGNWTVQPPRPDGPPHGCGPDRRRRAVRGAGPGVVPCRLRRSGCRFRALLRQHWPKHPRRRRGVGPVPRYRCPGGAAGPGQLRGHRDRQHRQRHQLVSRSVQRLLALRAGRHPRGSHGAGPQRQGTGHPHRDRQQRLPAERAVVRPVAGAPAGGGSAGPHRRPFAVRARTRTRVRVQRMARRAATRRPSMSG